MNEKKAVLDIYMDEFARNFIDKNCVDDEIERVYARKFLLDFKNIINDLSISEFLFFSKEEVEIIRQFFGVFSNGIGRDRTFLREMYNLTDYQLDFIIKDFYMTLGNVIYKELWKKRYGVSDGEEQQIGLQELNLNLKVYNALKRAHFNSIQDLTSVCTRKLSSLKDIGRFSYYEILKAVHQKQFKFVDERDKSIEELIEKDNVKKKKRK